MRRDATRCHGAFMAAPAAAPARLRRKLRHVCRGLNSMSKASWILLSLVTLASPAADHYRIAYFSAEFGIAECLPIDSRGLGPRPRGS